MDLIINNNRRPERESYMNQATEKRTKHILIITEICYISACRPHAQRNYLMFVSLFFTRLRSRLSGSRRQTRLPSRDSFPRDDRCIRHRGKLHRLECRLLGELDIPVKIGMRGCNPITVLIQKNHGSMVRVVAVGRGVKVSAIHVS